MRTITIDDPKIREFVNNEFHGDNNLLMQNFYDFLQFTKIKKETSEAQEEIKRGVFLEENEVFDPLISRYN